jgi:hypothetical protein
VSPFYLDHVVVGVRDLDAATADWRALGLVATDGGRHPEGGTRNAIVRFPDRSFLELMAVTDPQIVARRSPSFLALLEQHPDGPISWALRVDDVEAARTGIEARGFRVGPLRGGVGERDSGKVARWRTFHIDEPAFPFVLEYDAPPTAEPFTAGLPLRGIAATIVQAPSGRALANRLAHAFGADVADGRVIFAGGEAVVVDEAREHPGVVGVELLVNDERAAQDYLRKRDVPASDGWLSDVRLHGLRVRLIVE